MSVGSAMDSRKLSAFALTWEGADRLAGGVFQGHQTTHFVGPLLGEKIDRDVDGRVETGTRWLEMTVDQQPAFVAINPFLALIQRDATANAIAVGQ